VGDTSIGDWLGAVIGLVHGLFVLLTAMSILPGFLALNYGRRTPLAVVVVTSCTAADVARFVGPTSAGCINSSRAEGCG
jgi:hypothetical protein